MESLKKTYITKMPDKAGAFLSASRIICKNGGNIVRVNYNKSVDAHTLFIEVNAKEREHKHIWSELSELGYLTEVQDKSTKIEWFKPVFADDILTGKAEVTKLTKRSNRNGIVELTIYAYNQHGELVLTDVTEAIVKCKM